MTPSLAARGPIPAEAGIGLRFQHHQDVVDSKPAVPWFEVHTENYMGGGPPLRYLDAIRTDYPISLHGVGLSLGSTDGLDPTHLERVHQTVERLEPGLVSEHLAWCVTDGVCVVDLLPLPMTEEALNVVSRHIDQVQTALKRAILIENPSTYLQFAHSPIPEWEFMAAVAQRTGCGILCDVNNIFVSASNHGWSPSEYLAALPPKAIGEIHLAGHSVRNVGDGRTIRVDDHGSRVIPEVWELYAEALHRFGPVPTLIEWDNNVPGLDVLMGEAAKAAAVIKNALPEDGHADAA
ncbi:MAG: DUF692 family protein [Thiobacillus sp.]|nr:DUF692 family protein [Thiobacillus sp.]